jgi:hypothetical protein
VKWPNDIIGLSRLLQQNRPKADVRERLIDVSFRGNNRHQNEKALFPLLTHSGPRDDFSICAAANAWTPTR